MTSPITDDNCRVTQRFQTQDNMAIIGVTLPGSWWITAFMQWQRLNLTLTSFCGQGKLCLSYVGNLQDYRVPNQPDWL